MYFNYFASIAGSNTLCFLQLVQWPIQPADVTCLRWPGLCETQRQRAGAGKICWLTCSLPALSESPFWILHHICFIKFEATVSLVNLYPFSPVTRFKDNISELNVATKSQKITFLDWKLPMYYTSSTESQIFKESLFFFWKQAVLLNNIIGICLYNTVFKNDASFTCVVVGSTIWQCSSDW